MIDLSDITLVCIDTKNFYPALSAIERSCKNIKFGNVYFFTNQNIKTKSNINFYMIDKILSKGDYSKFCVRQLKKYIQTKFCLTIQHDGFIINPEAWTNEFLNYDYIGAPWPINWGYCNRIGNGGFSLRSKKYLETVSDILKDWNFENSRENNDITDNEDYLANVTFYNELIKNNIKFPSVELAAKFSVEHYIPELTEKTFGFHDYFTETTKRIKHEKFVNLAI